MSSSGILESMVFMIGELALTCGCNRDMINIS